MGEVDTVDVIRQQWAREFPDLDTRSLGITHRITALATRINRDAEAVFGRLGVSGATFDVLAALYSAGPPHQLSPTQLYQGRLISSGGMTARLDLAEGAGLVARSRAQGDRRGVIVTLTDRGVRVVLEGVVALVDHEADLGTALSPAQREAITRLLTKLLSQYWESPSRANPSLVSAESLAAAWLRTFPDLDPWLIRFLAAVPLMTSRIERESETVVKAMELTPNGFGLLCALRRAGTPFHLTPSQLYDIVVLSPAGVSGQLDKLERAGLIERSSQPEDKRVVRVSLTKRGQKGVKSTIGDFVMRHALLTNPLSAEEQGELAALLRRILLSVERRREQAPGDHYASTDVLKS